MKYVESEISTMLLTIIFVRIVDILSLAIVAERTELKLSMDNSAPRGNFEEAQSLGIIQSDDPELKKLLRL